MRVTKHASGIAVSESEKEPKLRAPAVYLGPMDSEPEPPPLIRLASAPDPAQNILNIRGDEPPCSPLTAAFLKLPSFASAPSPSPISLSQPHGFAPDLQQKSCALALCSEPCLISYAAWPILPFEPLRFAHGLRHSSVCLSPFVVLHCRLRMSKQ